MSDISWMNANFSDSSADRRSHDDESHSCRSALAAQFDDKFIEVYCVNAEGRAPGWQLLRAHGHLFIISQRENGLMFL